jgi:hypothetical protein
MRRARQLIVSCVCAASALRAQRGGLNTEFIQRGDTTVARVNGAVPAAAVKRLVEVLRIQPTDDDTAMYSVMYDFIVDRQRRAWAYDSQDNAVYLFDAHGSLLRRIGRKGGGPGEFQGNDGMAFLRDGRFAQLDLRNGRISFFSANGDFLTSWPVPATNFFGGMSIVIDTTDAIRLRWRGKWGDNLRAALLVHLREGGGGFAADTVAMPPTPIRNETFIVGRVGFGIPFQPFFSVGWHWSGGIVTANGKTGVITINQPGGRVVRVERNAPTVRVTRGERDQAEANLTRSAKQENAAWNGKLPTIPDVKPVFGSMFTARDGRIWVQVAGAAEAVPIAERLKPRAGRPAPVMNWRSATVWEVYERNGTFLGRIPFSKNGVPTHAFGNEVWVRETTPDGFAAIVRYRVEPGLDR